MQILIARVQILQILISSYKFYKKAKNVKRIILSRIQKKKKNKFEYLIPICICYLFEFKYFNYVFIKIKK